MSKQKSSREQLTDSSSQGGKSIEQLFREVADGIDENVPLEEREEEREVLAKLKEGYRKDRLEIVLDTQSEIADLKSEVQAMLDDDNKISDQEKERLDEVVHDAANREQVEDEISSRVEGIETISDLRGLSLDRLFDLESKFEGIMFYAFTDFAGEKTKLDFESYYSWYKAPKAGDEFKINFYGNQEAYNGLGAGDILPPTVRGITVYPGGVQSDATKRVSTRRLGLKGETSQNNKGFFDAQGYIPVYTKDVVVIGGVDMSFDEKYRKESTIEGRLGELDHDAYGKDHGSKDTEFVGKLPSTARKSKYHHGGSLDGATRERLGLDEGARNLRGFLRKKPDVLVYAKKYREKYAAESGIDIPEGIMFAFAKMESGFRFDIMNLEGSGAGGLFQFMPRTWTDFLNANPWARAKLENDSIWGKMDEQQWRFNPEIMMAAGYWYATENMKSLRQNKNQFTYSRFRESGFFNESSDGTITIREEDAWIIYLAHHDGLGGAMRMLRYKGYRENNDSVAEATAKAGLAGWQKWEVIQYKPKLIYDKSKLIPDKHWKRRVVNPGFDTLSKKYGRVLEGVESGAESDWGWGGEVVAEGAEVASVRADQVRLVGDSLMWHSSRSGALVGGERTSGVDDQRTLMYGKRADELLEGVRSAGRAGELDDIKVAVIEGGANNFNPDETTGRKPPVGPYTAEDVTGYLGEMMKVFREASPGVKLVLVTIPPVKGCSRYMVEGGYEETLKVNQWIREQAAGDSNITLVDLYEAVEDPAREGYMRAEYDMGDGLHLSGRDPMRLQAGTGKALFSDLLERGVEEASA